LLSPWLEGGGGANSIMCIKNLRK